MRELSGKDKKDLPLVRTGSIASKLIAGPEFPFAGSVEQHSTLCIDGFPRRKNFALVHVFSIPVLVRRIPHSDKRILQLNRFLSNVCQ